MRYLCSLCVVLSFDLVLSLAVAEVDHEISSDPVDEHPTGRISSVVELDR